MSKTSPSHAAFAVDDRDLDLASDGEDRLTVPEVSENTPAIQALSRQQEDLLADFVAGFESRAEVLRWGQAAQVYSLGQFDSDIVVEAVYSSHALGILVGPQWAPEDRRHEEATARRIREVVAGSYWIPAASEAQRKMRYLAVQYDGRGNGPQSEGQRHPGMRPLLSEIDKRQTWTLDTFLSGFDSRREFLSWVLRATESTWAEVDSGLADRVLARTPTAGDLLLRDSLGAQYFRESVAAEELLTPFGKAVETAAEHSREVSERTQEVGQEAIR